MIPGDTNIPSPTSSLPNLRGAQQSRRFDATIIDVENLRGRSGFAFSHAQVLESLKIWNPVAGSTGQLILAIDHGHEPSSYWLPEAGYSVVFAGRNCKADDTIALDLVPFLSKALGLERIQVVTADVELKQRCLRAVDGSRLEIMSPDLLLSDLEKIFDAYPMDLTVSLEDNEDDDSGPDEPSGLVDKYELKLGGELLEVEALLRKRAGMNSKRRKKLRLRGQRLWQKLEAVSPAMLARVVDVLKNGRNCETVRELSRSERSDFLSRWEKEQRSRRRREKTQDRVVLAENLRMDLEEKYSPPLSAAIPLTDNMPCAKAYVFDRNEKNAPIIDETIVDVHPGARTIEAKQTGPLRLVVISDTHGYEAQLTSNGRTLPVGDILLHLGDFAVDRSFDQAQRLQKFDAWMATAAAHIPTKIVLRGNHDPRFYEFTKSGATYITQARVQEIAGYNFAFVPYISGGLRRKKCLPKTCDVLVSHVPPYRVLDRCVTGVNAGSKTLLKGAQRMTAGPPSLWLCGHIHESRGVVRKTVFCMNQETTVINAACANSGIASHLEFGPLVLQLGVEGASQGSNSKLKRQVEILSMDGQYVFMNQKDPYFFQNKVGEPESRQMLMSVDLGLRTGVSLFDESGRLRRFANFRFESAEELRKMATKLLEEWEIDANKQTDTTKDAALEAKKWKVTHIAIEGEDPPLASAWRQAANGQRSILSVKPEEWRADLLTNEEQLSGESSKAASRRLAQQIVTEYGDFNTRQQDNGSEFQQTDMAESVLLGLHVSRRLGWTENRDPAVSRSFSRR